MGKLMMEGLRAKEIGTAQTSTTPELWNRWVTLLLLSTIKEKIED
jgi:hypothetical protein